MRYLVFFLIMVSSLFSLDISYKSFQSKFSQSITNEENRTVVYEGSVYALEPSILVWEYKTPVEKKIYYIKNKVVIVEPELEQVIYTSLQNVPKLNDILKDSIFVSKNNYKSFFKNKQISFVVDDSNVLKNMNYKDEVGNFVEIKFWEQIVDGKIDPKVYELSFPDDYDIISQ